MRPTVCNIFSTSIVLLCVTGKKIICSIPLPLMGFSGYFLRSFTYSPRHCSDITDIIIASLLANGTLSFKNPCRPAHQLIMLWQRSVRFAAFNWTSGKGTAHLGWLCCSTFSFLVFFLLAGEPLFGRKGQGTVGMCNGKLY